MKTFFNKTHLFINFFISTFFFIFFLSQANEDLSTITALAYTMASATNLLNVSFTFIITLY